MPTVIDSLIVRLGLDSKGLNSAAPASTRKLKELEQQGKKTEAEVKQLGETSKETASGVETLTSGFVKLLAVIGGTMAIKHFIEDQIEANAQIDRLSKNLGVSASTIASWGNAVEELGGTAKGLQGTMTMLSASQTELMLTGQSSLIPYLSMMGVSLATVDGKARQVNDVLADMASWAEGKNRTTAHNVFARMGIDEGTINLLLLGRKELELTLARQKEYGEQVKKFAPVAQKLQTALVDLKQKFTLLGLSLLQQAAPALEKFLNMLLRFGNWLQTNIEFVKDFGVVLGVVGAALGAIAVLSSPITLTVAAIVALAAAIALLWQDYQVWKRGGQSFIDWSIWGKGIDLATAGIHALTSAIDALRSTYSALQKLMHGDFKGAANEFVNGGGPTVLDRFKASRAGQNHGVTSQAALAEAKRVSAKTGIPADILYAQWAHETGNFTNRGAKQLNNLAGVNVPGGKGKNYRQFKSLDDFGDYFAYLMRPGGHYPGAAGARTVDQYAQALKAGGYYSDSESNYAAGMRHALANAGGTGAGASSTDASVTNHIGKIDVYTQATDAHGIAQDMGRSMNYLFTSQANAGLF